MPMDWNSLGQLYNQRRQTQGQTVDAQSSPAQGANAMDWNSLKGSLSPQSTPAYVTGTRPAAPGGRYTAIDTFVDAQGRETKSSGGQALSVPGYTNPFSNQGGNPQDPATAPTAPPAGSQPTQPTPTPQTSPATSQSPLAGWAQMQQINNQPRPNAYQQQRQRMPRWFGKSQGRKTSPFNWRGWLQGNQ